MSDKLENENDKKEENNFNSIAKKEYTKKVGNYILSEQIGLGTFSKVTKATHTLTGEQVAVKILDKSKIKDNIDIERISREIEILKSISHPNISQLYESNSTIHNFYLVMEYIEGGDLCEYINKNISLSEQVSCHFFRQLISVIEYLCEMGVAHRDIKPENILLDASQKNIKVIDFGLSNYCADTELLKSACGSPCFASPEMLSGNPYNGIATDLWSSGIVLYSMLVGTLPFDDHEINSLYDQIKIGTFYIPSTLSLEAIDFLKKILQVEPKKRINLEQIKQHPWFNIEKNKLYKGIDLTIETFPYNIKLIRYVLKKFYENDKEINENNFIKMIQYHACNQYTATYYLSEKSSNKAGQQNFEENENIENKKEQAMNIMNINSSKKENDDNIKITKNNFENKQDKNGNKDYNNKERGVLKNIIKKKENSNIKENIKTKKNRSISNTYRNKGKNLNIIKKELISFKKSPYVYYKIRKNNFINNKKISLFPNFSEINKKLSCKMSTPFESLNGLKLSENNSRNKKTKSWQKKDKGKNKNKTNKKMQDKTNYQITRNYYINHNYIAKYQKKHSSNNQSVNLINNIRIVDSFLKKGNKSLTDRANFSNSIFNDESQKRTKSYNSRDKKNITPNSRRNTSNNSKNKKINEYNSINISNNFINKKENKHQKKSINITNKNKNKNSFIFTFNKNKTNIYNNYNTINSYNNINNYISTEGNRKLKKNKKSDNISKRDKRIEKNTINKYKTLIDEFKSGGRIVNRNKNQKKKKLKKILSKLEFNHKIEGKNTIKNSNKYSLIINPSQNHSLSKNKTLNNISNNNLNTLSNNISNIDESNNKIRQKLIKTSLKNKKNVSNNDKCKIFQPLKYKKNNLKIKISANNSKINIDSKQDILIKKGIRKKYRNSSINNSLNQRNNSSFIKSNLNKRIKNPFSKNVSSSSENNNNTNIKSNDNNKKIINININNILKINRKYSINLTKSNENSKNTTFTHHNTEKIENRHLPDLDNCSNIFPNVTDKNIKNKGVINYYINKYTNKNKQNIMYHRNCNEQINNQNYSSMLKKQLYEEKVLNKNNK